MGGRFSSLLMLEELQVVVRDLTRSEHIAFTDVTSNEVGDLPPIISSVKHLILCYFHLHLKYIWSVDKFIRNVIL